MTRPLYFTLERSEDVSGVSGTGTVAHGIVWPDNTVALWWPGKDGFASSCAIWGDIEAVINVHGHGGKTVARFELDTPAGVMTGIYPNPNARPCPKGCGADLSDVDEHARFVNELVAMTETNDADDNS